jgi:CheY-like chemotaxis protein
MKILIVDDQELVILSLEKCLVDLGYDVVSANNVSDAIKMYDEHSPNLVIADINMPFLLLFFQIIVQNLMKTLMVLK